MTKNSAYVLGWFIVGALFATGLYWATQGDERSQLKGEGVPVRIICAAPSAVETVFALGEGERVIAVSDFTVYPPEAVAMETIGGYINPNFERILALRPDLIITQGESEKLTAFCRERGIDLLRIDMSDVETILFDIQRIGETLGVNEKAHVLRERLRRELDAIAANAAMLERPSVFLSLSRTAGTLSNIMTAGGGTYFGDLLEIAGGENLFADIDSPYPQISAEALARRAPEVILEFRLMGPASLDVERQVFKDWERMSTLPAVRNGRIHWVTEDYFLIPGPRVAQAAQRLHELIHGKGGDR